MPSVQWDVYESFQALLQAGPYHLVLEGILVLWIIWLLSAKSKNRDLKLTKKEEEQLLAEWTPEPLVTNAPDANHPSLHTRTVHGKIERYIDLGKGFKLLNLGSQNFLSMSENKEVEKAALDTLAHYGVGACGPRGFYGTSLVHLQFEEKIAQFFNLEMGVLYSYGFSTVASAIPSYSKSGDVIFVDEFVSFPIQRGLQASRSRIVYFKHNDTKHLEELLQEQARVDKKDPKKAAATRRFLVVEGLYLNIGDICPLPELVHLRQKYRLRLFIDESYSFGVLGQYGRGVTEYFNIPLKEVDLITASLETSIASIGGFCVGTKFVVEHQRLSGLGYCFSAALPPMLAAAAIKAVEILESDGPEMTSQLQDKCLQFHEALTILPDKVSLSGDAISPVKHLRLTHQSGSYHRDEAVLRAIVKKAEDNGVAYVVAAYLVDKETFLLPPSIRICLNKDLTTEEINKAVTVLNDAVQELIPDKLVPDNNEDCSNKRTSEVICSNIDNLTTNNDDSENEK